MDILAHLKRSLEDNYFSKGEKNDLKSILGNQSLDAEALNYLRTKIFDLANEKATSENYQMVMQWVKDANNVLLARLAEQSESYFSPGEACRNAIIEHIRGALKHLKICVFTISDDHITRAILLAHQKGISVKIITDNDKSFDLGSDIEQLAKARIPIKMDNTNNHMHHKFMIVDDRIVLTGSYNWTSSAARFNHENIVMTRENGVVKSFLKEFDRLWAEMAAY
jgi:mitochondrial cardiolipin hydrolase